MDIRQLTYFMVIAEEGQITAAARRLHMAQPPLSQQMKALEEELGVQLLQREPRSVTLTDAGEILYRRARQIITLTDSTRREIADFKNGLRGTLSIGTVSSSGSVILRPALRQFHDSHRGIRFEIYDGNTFRVLDMLGKGLIEIGIVRTPFKQDAFDCTLLPEEPMVLAYADTLADPSPGQTSLTIEQLQGLHSSSTAASTSSSTTSAKPTTSRRTSSAAMTTPGRPCSGPKPAWATPSSRHRPSHRPACPSSRPKPSTNRACAPNWPSSHPNTATCPA